MMFPACDFEDLLRLARGVIADITHTSDTEIRNACAIIKVQSDDPKEKARAEDLMVLVNGEAEPDDARSVASACRIDPYTPHEDLPNV